VLVEWSGTGSSADQVLVKRNGADAFDGTNTYLVGHKGTAIQIAIAEILQETGMVLIDLCQRTTL
jgi:hypothetical protein